MFELEWISLKGLSESALNVFIKFISFENFDDLEFILVLQMKWIRQNRYLRMTDDKCKRVHHKSD